MNYLKALLIILSTLSCVILDAMIPEDLTMRPISEEEACQHKKILTYLAHKALGAPEKTPKNIHFKGSTISILFPETVSDIELPSTISSFCVNDNNSRLAFSLADKTIHSFLVPKKECDHYNGYTIKNAEHLTKHMCFGPDSTLVTINPHEVICANFDNQEQALFGLEGFDRFGTIVNIFSTDSSQVYIVLTEKEPQTHQFLSLKFNYEGHSNASS